MIARPPGLHDATKDAFSSGDLERLCALYEADAALMAYEADAALMAADPGVAGSAASAGRSSVREQWAALLEIGGTLESITRFVIERDDLALLSASWTLTVDGNDMSRGVTAEVARRQDDGGWLYVIDAPFALNGA